MPQLDPSRYKRLTQPMTYGQDDGLFWDSTDSKLVLAIANVGVFTIDAAGAILAGAIEAPDLEVSGETRGDVLRRGAAAWERHAALTSGQLVGGDGTDVKSMSISGDVTLSVAAGNLVSAIGSAKVLDAMIASKIVKDAGAQAVAWLDSTGVGADTETVGIGARTYELDTHDTETITAGNVRVDVSGGSTVKSQGTLTLTENAADTNTVTIDAKVYTFQAVLTNVDGNVLIGATASDSIDNLIAAINLAAGAGTTYAAATTVHPTVSAAIGAGDTMIATAKAGGVEGDTIATTDTLAGASAWDAVTLGTTTAGVSPTNTEVATALATAINADASRVMDAIDVGDGTVLLVTKASGATMPALAEASANITKSGAAATGGAAAAVRTVHMIKHTVTAAEVTVLSDVNGVVSIAALPLTAAPTLFTVEVRTSAGVLKPCANSAFAWVQANTNWYVLKLTDSAGGPDVANTDVIAIVAVA